MRNTRDRIRHATSFELIALIMITPLGAWAFDEPVHDIGMITIVSATIAMVLNYAFNLLFDLAMLHYIGNLAKSLIMRIVHAVLFEVGLLTVLMPFIAWYLDIALFQAFLIDASFSLFYLIYAFVFNWGYDVLFPIPKRPMTGIEGKR